MPSFLPRANIFSVLTVTIYSAASRRFMSVASTMHACALLTLIMMVNEIMHMVINPLNKNTLRIFDGSHNKLVLFQ